MFKKLLVISSLALTITIPNTLWAKENCACMMGSMTKCQSAMDQMMMDKLGKKTTNTINASLI